MFAGVTAIEEGRTADQFPWTESGGGLAPGVETESQRPQRESVAVAGSVIRSGIVVETVITETGRGGVNLHETVPTN